MLILICVDHGAKMHALLQKKKQFGVSVLKQNQQAISEYFAKREHSAKAEQRLGIHYRRRPRRPPTLDGTLLPMDCKVSSAHLAGQHNVFSRGREDVGTEQG